MQNQKFSFENVKIYHILHIDRLCSVVNDGYLHCDLDMAKLKPCGTTIGMQKIKQRRQRLKLNSYQSLSVGECVPFYFCPRSVMLYMFYKKNHPEITYNGGQEPIIHLEADLCRTIRWAEANGLRWVFTNSNAGSEYFEDYCNLDDLDKINWQAVNATDWRSCREQKQAEFLIEKNFSWDLVERIGVYSDEFSDKLKNITSCFNGDISVEVKRDWYY